MMPRLVGTGTQHEQHQRATPLLVSDQLPASGYSLRGATAIVICSFCLFVCVAAFVMKLDIYAVAQARIQPIGRSKPVQAFETGKVRAIHVNDGSVVEPGTVLLQLDSELNEADRQALEIQIASLEAEIARRRSAMETALREEHRLPQQRRAGRDAMTPPGEPVDALAAVVAHLIASLEAIDIQVADHRANAWTLQQSIGDQTRLVDILTERVNMRMELLKSGLGPRISVIDAQESLATAIAKLTELRGEAARAAIATRAAQADKNGLIRRFVQENSEAVVHAQAKRDELSANLLRAKARVGYSRLVAPIHGVVQELSVNTIGQVVAGGQRLMTIVPDNAPLEAEALIQNADIGVLRVGQAVVLKIETFPFTRYGTVTGRVTKISRDATSVFTGNDGTQSSPLRGSRAANLPSDFAYPVSIALDRVDIGSGAQRSRLLPGMNARAEIRIGDRRVIDYFLSPLREIASEAIRER
jgi:hemolysin D